MLAPLAPYGPGLPPKPLETTVAPGGTLSTGIGASSHAGRPRAAAAIMVQREGTSSRA